MANGVNKAILVGNLGKNPELRYTSSGQPVASFSLATSESYKDKAGARQTRTTWHNIVMWGKLAEVANQYLKKGSTVYLEGRIDNRSYDDKDGNKKYISEVVIDKMVMLGGRNSGSDDSSSADIDNSSYGAAMPPSGSTDSAAVQTPAPEDNDLPF